MTRFLALALGMTLALGLSCARHFVVMPERVKTLDNPDWTVESAPNGIARDSSAPTP